MPLFVSSARTARAVLAACVALSAVLDAQAAPPRLVEASVSDAPRGAAKTQFPAQVPEIFVHVKVADAPPGTKVRAEWISVKTPAAPPNYKIQGVESALGAGVAEAEFNMSKPTAGWPPGEYRVDLLVDGKPARQLPFRVVK